MLERRGGGEGCGSAGHGIAGQNVPSADLSPGYQTVLAPLRTPYTGQICGATGTWRSPVQMHSGQAHIVCLTASAELSWRTEHWGTAAASH
ncbi:hypothetical protein WJX72_009137 [[Myrmecia] bisecta]|uniref:Uncharacterized protein n=1 Tax=[Myrmecia] bisecta TaxID=41462 RepID=A0AAW1R9A0_9CHLO